MWSRYSGSIPRAKVDPSLTLFWQGINWIPPSPLWVDLTPTASGEITSGCQISACQSVRGTAESSAYHTNFSLMHKYPAVPTPDILWIMVQHRHTLILSASEVIKSPNVSELWKSANSKYFTRLTKIRKHTDGYCAHAERTQRLTHSLFFLISITSHLFHLQ